MQCMLLLFRRTINHLCLDKVVDFLLPKKFTKRLSRLLPDPTRPPPVRRLAARHGKPGKRVLAPVWTLGAQRKSINKDAKNVVSVSQKLLHLKVV